MNIVVSSPKEGKAYGKKTEEPVFVGRKLGETVQLDAIGLKGYKAVIAGGSDKDGFPMKRSLEGQQRKKLLMEKGVGVRNKRKGMRKRRRVRGNIIARDIHQLNLKVTEYGPEKLESLLKKEPAEAKEAGKKTAKEKALDQKLLSAEEGKPKEAQKEEKPAAEEKKEEPKAEGKPADKPAEEKPEAEKEEEAAEPAKEEPKPEKPKEEPKAGEKEEEPMGEKAEEAKGEK